MAFLTDFPLDHMPRVAAVLAILAPWDPQQCPEEGTAFFDPALADAFLSRSVLAWLPYVSGSCPPYLLREARALTSM